MKWLGLVAGFALAASPSCRPPKCESEEEPLSLQILVQADCPNQAKPGECWPTDLVVLEFEREPKTDILRFDELIASEEDNLGLADALNVHRMTAFPNKQELWQLAIDPKAQSLLIIAKFQKEVGDGWFSLSRVPQRACEAKKKREPVVDPCLYVLLEDFGIFGGVFPPAGFDRTKFNTECASLVKSVSRLQTEKTDG